MDLATARAAAAIAKNDDALARDVLERTAADADRAERLTGEIAVLRAQRESLECTVGTFARRLAQMRADKSSLLAHLAAARLAANGYREDARTLAAAAARNEHDWLADPERTWVERQMTSLRAGSGE